MWIQTIFTVWVLLLQSQEVELKDRDTRLRILSDEQDKVIRMQQMQQEKIRKDIDGVRKQLTHERSLKLDAFTRVDDLQTQVIYVFRKHSCLLIVFCGFVIFVKCTYLIK